MTGLHYALLVVSILCVQGCASMHHQGPRYQEPGLGAAFMRGYQHHDPSRRHWDPPVHQGYGARIPNMQGDWDRFCVDNPSDCG